MNKRQLCDQIIEKMEWWRHGSWANHIDMRTKDDVITVMQNVVDGIASNRQTYKKEVHPAADVQPVKWIPFEIRDLDEEEKEEHPEWDWILVGELPEDGQRILVNVRYNGHDHVEMDEYYNDDGCYLDSGNEIGTEATHWMPLPEPPKDGET